MIGELASDKLFLFLVFLIPGFISIRVYALFVATNPLDLSKQLPEVVAYSAIHYALTGWLILVAPTDLTRIVAAYLVVLVIPIVWPPLILLARDWNYYKNKFFTRNFPKYLLAPEATPWDSVFRARDAQWIRIKLKSGDYVGGILGPDSWTSTYPSPEQLFVSERYECDDIGFGQRSEGKGGILVNGEEIEFIELF